MNEVMFIIFPLFSCNKYSLLGICHPINYIEVQSIKIKNMFKGFKDF